MPEGISMVVPVEPTPRSRRCSGQRARARAVLMTAALLCGPPAALADVVLDWNLTMFATTGGQNPFVTARYAAITHLAMFEAVNAVEGEYRPYIGIEAASDASAEAAAAAAAHAVLRAYFPARAVALDAALAASLASIPDGPSEDSGVAAGRAAATAMLALRANDGSAVPQPYVPTSNDPGRWQLTAVCPPSGGGLQHWGNVTPFGIPAARQFRPGPPPPLTSGPYRDSYDEVKAVGGINSVLRTPDRTDVARLYATFSPVAWANSAARQIIALRGGSTAQNARAFALLNMAISDAAVVGFEAKYYYELWRPETAIRAAATDGNKKTEPDVDFTPLIAAPCFPSYPSNHAILSNAGRAVLEHLFGADGHDLTISSPAVPGVMLHYTSLSDITDDIDDARVFGGIHFRFDQEVGGRQGEHIGDYVYNHHLRPVHPGVQGP